MQTTLEQEVEGLKLKKALLIQEKSSHVGREFDEIDRDIRAVEQAIRSFKSARSGTKIDWARVREGKRARAAWSEHGKEKAVGKWGMASRQ